MLMTENKNVVVVVVVPTSKANSGYASIPFVLSFWLLCVATC